MASNCLLEKAVQNALGFSPFRFCEDGGKRCADGLPPLDFHLCDKDIHIEVKQFHSDRISRQCASAPNVIVLQGAKSVEWFCKENESK